MTDERQEPRNKQTEVIMKKLDDYENTFKYELGGETGGNYLIYSGKGGDKFYLMTPSIAFFNFKKEDLYL